MYQIYYVVDGVPFMLKCDTYSDALKHCALLELDNLTDKYELTQTIKTYERNKQDKSETNNDSGNKYQNTRTCKKTSCRNRTLCGQLRLPNF